MSILLCILPPVAPDYPSLGAATLAGALGAAGHACRILDTNIRLYRRHSDERWRWSDIGWYSWNSPAGYRNWIESVAEMIAKGTDPPKISGIALSASSAAKPFALATIKRLRRHFPSLPILLGGAGFFHPEDIEAFPATENIQICRGEGDEAIVLWAKQLQSGKDGGRVMEANVRDLDSLAAPDFSPLVQEDYTRPGVFPAETSRGCVNHCAFCDDTQMWRGFRMKSPQKVAQDLAELPKATRHVSFCDSLLNPNPGRMLAICEAIAPQGLTWDGMLQCRGVDETVAKAMYDSGCRDVFLGVESFNPALLRKLNKASSAEDAGKAIRALHQAGVKPSMGLIIAGPPFQNRADFELDMKKLEELADCIASVAVNPLCIPQGTPLWETGKRLGFVFPAEAPWQFWHEASTGPGLRFRWTIEAVRRLSDLGIFRACSTPESISHLRQLVEKAEKMW